MNITYFSKYSAQGPSSRYRVFQFLEYFRNAGIELNVEILFDDQYFEILRIPRFPSGFLRKVFYVASRFRERKKSLRRNIAKLSVVEQQLFPYLPYSVEKQFLPKKYLLEFDDAIYLTHPKKLPNLIRSATAILAGNKTLAEYAAGFNDNVHIIPTVVDTDVFSPLPKPLSDKVRIGWSGLEYNFKFLRILEPVLKNLMKKYPLEVVILSGSSPEIFSFPFRFEKWDPNHEAEQMNQFDIGVMPLNNDEWSKGKCGMKLLQFMSLEIPSVVTPIGVNLEIIKEGENGYTAAKLEDWEQRLSKLIEGSSLRQTLGSAARQTVIENYSVKVWFPRILSVYQSFSGNGE